MTAAAHKLARIVYHMITLRQEYDVTVFQDQERCTQGSEEDQTSCASERTWLSTRARRVCSLGEPASVSPGNVILTLAAGPQTPPPLLCFEPPSSGW